MRTVTTVNSVYQINEADHLIRRVTGVSDPTPRQGADGEWREYERILPHPAGGLLIVWVIASGKCTWTSNVVSDTNRETESCSDWDCDKCGANREH